MCTERSVPTPQIICGPRCAHLQPVPLVSRTRTARQRARKRWYASVAIPMRRAAAGTRAGRRRPTRRKTGSPNYRHAPTAAKRRVSGPFEDSRTTDVMRKTVAATGSASCNASGYLLHVKAVPNRPCAQGKQQKRQPAVSSQTSCRATHGCDLRSARAATRILRPPPRHFRRRRLTVNVGGDDALKRRLHPAALAPASLRPKAFLLTALPPRGCMRLPGPWPPSPTHPAQVRPLPHLLCDPLEDESRCASPRCAHHDFDAAHTTSSMDIQVPRRMLRQGVPLVSATTDLAPCARPLSSARGARGST